MPPQSLQGLLVPPYTVAGRINSGAFHKAKAIAEGCDASASAEVTPLLPADYDKLLESLKVSHGGPAFLHTAGVVVYSETAGFIGDDAQLLQWLKRNKVANAEHGANSDGRAESWDTIAEEEYLKLLTESGLTFAFLEMQMDGTVLGRLIFELYTELAPKTCENFLALCSGSYGDRKDVASYVGTPIHRIKPGGWLQGGDVKTGRGDGGVTASGEPLADESFAIEHTELGILGMANNGQRHTAASQFYVTFAPCPSFDKKYVAFGKLIDGTKLLKFLEDLDCRNDRPRSDVIISDAGVVAKKELALMDMDEDEAAVKLQKLQRARKQRKEMQERKEAAKRVQAAKRGAAARKAQREQQQAAVQVQKMHRGRKARKSSKA